ncbi:hypothetical protein VA596_47150 [Amycolatopsis sp., V23-08]|uniref:Uncharacterized protein n=1 Tax=Amycolatopsis heterodermiae TaxID=3110235 RepID=A0ABU5RPF9_9PSEU|nr:hypothetical protein [Amycolatopsis sp., V23-08]MEA5367176.1 hypothetical protein [Amycolatopsis sp., V23-08]
MEDGEGEADIGERAMPVGWDRQLHVPGQVIQAVRGEFRHARAGEPDGVEQRGVGEARTVVALAVQQGPLGCGVVRDKQDRVAGLSLKP